MVKYLDIISKKTKVLSDTIAASATDITVFLVLFFVVYFGFCVAFNIAFGSDIEMYKSIKDCLISIFRTMLGDFDYEAMKASVLFLWRVHSNLTPPLRLPITSWPRSFLSFSSLWCRLCS